MTPEEFNNRVVSPGLTLFEDVAGLPFSEDAARMLVAIGGQEAGWQHRYQIVANNPNAAGPAKGFFQFERRGGVAGVMTHRATAGMMRVTCAYFSVPFNDSAIWRAIEGNDFLAVAAARLLLWSDPRPLPKVEEETIAWGYYIRNWRPGKPHPKSWNRNWEGAMSVYPV
jgi:hypothetical protein